MLDDLIDFLKDTSKFAGSLAIASWGLYGLLIIGKFRDEDVAFVRAVSYVAIVTGVGTAIWRAIYSTVQATVYDDKD